MKKITILMFMAVILLFIGCAKNKRTEPQTTWDKNVATLSSYQVTQNVTNVPNMTKAQALENVRQLLILKFKDQTSFEDKTTEKEIHFTYSTLESHSYGGRWKHYGTQFYFADIRQIDIFVEEGSDKEIAVRCAINPFLCPMWLYLDGRDGRGQAFTSFITFKTGETKKYVFQDEYHARLLTDSLLVLAKQ